MDEFLGRAGAASSIEAIANNQDFSADPDLEGVRTNLRKKIPDPSNYFETLMQKYSRFTARLALNMSLFEKMDLIGPWIQLPFNVQNRNNGVNLCWNAYESMHARYRR